MNLFRSIDADRRAYGIGRFVAVYRLVTLSTWGLVVSYRISHWLTRHRVPVVPALLYALQRVFWAADISPAAVIGVPLRVVHSVGIVIGAQCVLGDNCEIFQNVTIGGRERDRANGTHAMPIVGRNVTLFAGAVVIGPIHIGDGSILGANAVVIRDVPEYTVVAGVPASIVGGVAEPHAIRSLPPDYP